MATTSDPELVSLAVPLAVEMREAVHSLVTLVLEVSRKAAGVGLEPVAVDMHNSVNWIVIVADVRMARRYLGEYDSLAEHAANALDGPRNLWAKEAEVVLPYHSHFDTGSQSDVAAVQNPCLGYWEQDWIACAGPLASA